MASKLCYALLCCKYFSLDTGSRKQPGNRGISSCVPPLTQSRLTPVQQGPPFEVTRSLNPSSSTVNVPYDEEPRHGSNGFSRNRNRFPPPY